MSGSYLPLEWRSDQDPMNTQQDWIESMKEQTIDLQSEIMLSAIDALDVFLDRLEALGIRVNDNIADRMLHELLDAAQESIDG